MAAFAAVTGPPIVAYSRIVRTEDPYVFQFLLICFRIRRRLRLPEDFLPDRKVFALLACEVCSDDIMLCASKVIDAIRQILSNVDLPVWVGDFVDDLQWLRTPKKMGEFRQI